MMVDEPRNDFGPLWAIVGGPELIDPAAQQAAGAPAPDPVIRCRHVSKWFGSFRALHDISLDIETNEVVAIIGRSGSGKSTFLRCLNRLEAYDAGGISILGMADPDDERETRAVRERVGMVFQDFNLFPMLTVEQNVMLALRLVHGWSADRARHQTTHMLDRVDMIRHARKRPSELSGGEQQRVAIARTLATEPAVVLLDEPTASIDPELTRGVMRLVADVAADDMTIVIVTHDVDFARHSADRVLFFDCGRLVEDATPEKIFTDADRSATRQFLRDAKLLMRSTP